MSEPSRPRRDAVRVVCRVRPENEMERSRGGGSCVRIQQSSIEVNVDEGLSTFTYDQVFGPQSTQLEVFEFVALPLVQDVLEGYNATVFAYGQTASGKTHTMEGPNHRDPVLRGIIPRTVDALFEGVGNADERIEFTVKVSYVEIYMERIRDLLDGHHVKQNLQVREDRQHGIYIAGVTEEYVTNQDELLSVMAEGAANRAVAATGMNEGSSRSHSVFTMTVNQRDITNGSTKSAKLVLVDLAGSEMVRKTGASGQQLEEAKTINKSLSALGLVINALTDANSKHVPYRDSKLTRVLQDSIGGNSKTCLIIAVSPSSYNANETLSTLRFGNRAKTVQNKAVVNTVRSVEELEQLLEKAEGAIDVLRGHVVALEAQLEQQHGQSASDQENSEAARVIVQLQVRVEQLQQELQEEKTEAERLAIESDKLITLLNEKDRVLAETSEAINDLQRRLHEQREQMDGLLADKADTNVQAEQLRAAMADERERLAFEKEELRLTIEKLQGENHRLASEIEELSGDRAPRSSGGVDPVGSPPLLLPHGEVFSVAFRELDRILASPDLPQVCGTELRSWREAYIQSMTSLPDSAENSPRLGGPSASSEGSEKRVQELEKQRAKLEKDLEDRTARVCELERQLDEISGPNAASIIPERERNHTRLLQQRLEQLVAVHRQLLRKYASLELENGEYRKKTQLRDDRITQLEQQVRMMNSSMRTQAERHVQELTSFREKISSLRLEYQQHVQARAQQDSHAHTHHGEVRSIRGGGQEVLVKSIRGGGGGLGSGTTSASGRNLLVQAAEEAAISTARSSQTSSIFRMRP